jgi:hypothetical protein
MNEGHSGRHKWTHRWGKGSSARRASCDTMTPSRGPTLAMPNPPPTMTTCMPRYPSSPSYIPTQPGCTPMKPLIAETDIEGGHWHRLYLHLISWKSCYHSVRRVPIQACRWEAPTKGRYCSPRFIWTTELRHSIDSRPSLSTITLHHQASRGGPVVRRAGGSVTGGAARDSSGHMGERSYNRCTRPLMQPLPSPSPPTTTPQGNPVSYPTARPLTGMGKGYAQQSCCTGSRVRCFGAS